MQKYKKLFSKRYSYMSPYHFPHRPRRFASKRTRSLLPQLAMLLVAAALIVGLFGCGKQPGPQGPIGYPGAQGPKGEQGATGAKGDTPTLPDHYITSIVDPCGDAPGVIDEVLLILSDGQVLVSLSDQSNGKNTRLSILSSGAYVTTDGSSCNFVLHSDGSVTY